MVPALHLFKSLSDETRLRLLYVLNRYELNVNELVRFLGMGQSRVSRHLKILSDAGLLESRRDGLWVFYSVPKEGRGRVFTDAVLPFLAEAESAEGDMAMARGIIDERTRKTSQFFNSIADDWDNMSREILGDLDFEDKILERVPSPCRMAVDLGCGTGHMLERLLDRAEQVIGVDGSASMLELARRRLGASRPKDEGRISLRIGDLAHLPLADGEVDFVCINLVLHHLSAPGEVLREVGRVLKPEGTLVLSDFNKHEDEKMRLEYGDRWLGFPLENLREFLSKAGFNLSEASLAPVRKNLSIHFITATNKN
ncbi:metalloregulator ArsR/SmtB family transcription factor [Desulfovibrio sp. OttesenSCG-928-C14]|nr:metalloregulator ArsR/SmtB family transcription factor [Desulfovibrio sp. OttesenSCG-928-C14]